jgi:hypothetical protein
VAQPACKPDRTALRPAGSTDGYFTAAAGETGAAGAGETGEAAAAAGAAAAAAGLAGAPRRELTARELSS